MSIFVAAEDREGETLNEVFEIVSLHKSFPESGECLRYIRESVDTAFNVLQRPQLLAELDTLDQAGLTEAARKELSRVGSLCRKYATDRTVIIRFYGETGRGE
jgi:hypothetical protein